MFRPRSRMDSPSDSQLDEAISSLAEILAAFDVACAWLLHKVGGGRDSITGRDIDRLQDRLRAADSAADNLRSMIRHRPGETR